jgi:hypothetical protein
MWLPLQSENFNSPVDGHDISAQYNPAVHGTEGYVGVALPAAPRSIDDRIMQTTEQLEEFPFQLDMNSGEHLGVGGYTFAAERRWWMLTCI